MAKKKDFSFEEVLAKYQVEPEIEMIPTGIANLDTILGGGIALGYCYGLYGEPGAGKSSLCFQIIKSLCKQGLKCLMIDVEKSINKNQLDSFGLSTYREQGLLSVVSLTYYNELEEVIKAVSESDYKVVLLDSISAVVPYIDKNSNATLMQIGIRARQASNLMMQLKSWFYSAKIASLIIFQARANIGGGLYGPEFQSQGSYTEKHMVDLMLCLQISQKIKDDEDNIIGNKIWMMTEKNKFTRPFVRVQNNLIFGKGISKRYDLIEKGLELGVIEKSGRYDYKIPGMDEPLKGKKALYGMSTEYLRALQTAIDNYIPSETEL